MFLPVLLFHGRQYALAFGSVGHFLNAYITFHSFVQYTSPAAYLSLQLFAATLHGLGTVVGVYSTKTAAGAARNGAIALPQEDPEAQVNGDARQVAAFV